MTWLKIKNYSASAFDGLLEVSPAAFDPLELGGSVSEVETAPALTIPPGRRVTEFGWDGSYLYELSAAQMLEHETAVEQTGRARFTQGATANINQVAATLTNWTVVALDDLYYTDTSATTKTIEKDGIYRVTASITAVHGGAGNAMNVFTRLYINGAAQIRSRAASESVAVGNAVTNDILWEGPLVAADALTLRGTGLTSNLDSLDTSPDAGLWLIERIGSSS